MTCSFWKVISSHLKSVRVDADDKECTSNYQVTVMNRILRFALGLSFTGLMMGVPVSTFACIEPISETEISVEVNEKPLLLPDGWQQFYADELGFSIALPSSYVIVQEADAAALKDVFLHQMGNTLADMEERADWYTAQEIATFREEYLFVKYLLPSSVAFGKQTLEDNTEVFVGVGKFNLGKGDLLSIKAYVEQKALEIPGGLVQDLIDENGFELRGGDDYMSLKLQVLEDQGDYYVVSTIASRLPSGETVAAAESLEAHHIDFFDTLKMSFKPSSANTVRKPGWKTYEQEHFSVLLPESRMSLVLDELFMENFGLKFPVEVSSSELSDLLGGISFSEGNLVHVVAAYSLSFNSEETAAITDSLRQRLGHMPGYTLYGVEDGYVHEMMVTYIGMVVYYRVYVTDGVAFVLVSGSFEDEGTTDVLTEEIARSAADKFFNSFQRIESVREPVIDPIE